ncbi:hypothetical protein DPEC_G00262470 [Dallia pectoralis]|uniref:Uncharacterized protein n=1 Tax=Dallia pectoralis TaxID=75939 RepID=A0ACC2FRU9_DALPE|nr:hypothetical protein DPEC_G00262470 [Dallia pectoralis]
MGEMDSNDYDEFGFSESKTKNRGHIFPQKGMRAWVVYLLYGVLVFLLSILLVVTGIKFSQLRQEIVDVHVYLESLNKSITSAPAKSSSSNSDTIQHVYYDEIEIPVRGTCREGWWSFQGSCYLTSKKSLGWHNAEQECINLGAHLLVLNTVDEQDYISKVAEEGQRYWIGLVERTQEGHWTWVDGTDYKSTPKFWDAGQPDDWDYTANGEDCVELHPGPRSRRRLWNDSECTMKSRLLKQLGDHADPNPTHGHCGKVREMLICAKPDMAAVTMLTTASMVGRTALVHLWSS